MSDFETVGISLISAVIGGAIVAVVTHFLTRRRETEKRRTEKAIEYRIEAWRAIAQQTGRTLDSDAFEKALAEIVLFGNEQEVQLVSKIMDEFVANHTSDTTELLKLLRRNIREELGLQRTSIEFRWLRVYWGNESRRPENQDFGQAKSELGVTTAEQSCCPLTGGKESQRGETRS
jgi:hypothetical protein